MHYDNRIDLTTRQIPTHWYNIASDYKEPMAPMINPGTKEPLKPEELEAIFPRNLIEQELSTERWIEIPDVVRDIYTKWRPSTLFRARRLEQILDTPAHIYYKYEGNSPAGSHKPNTAVAQVYFNKLAGTTRLATETGAGQWGASLAIACAMFDIECIIYQVKVSYETKPYRGLMMQTFGGTVYASPSNNTAYGRKVLEQYPDCPGSLGIAISEAVEDTVTHPGTKYSLGSVMNHVCLHQTIIGQETITQMEMAGEEPDVVIACVGGGSNFAGIAFPWIGRTLRGENTKQVRCIAAEPASCPSLTKGELRYDFGDTAMMTPLMKMYTLGCEYMPPSIHAGGLRYHGMGPAVSHAYEHGLMEAVALPQTKAFEAAVCFARAEGLLPAPESSHAISAGIDEALKAKEEGKERVILMNISGNGQLDLPAYDSYLNGKLED